MSSVSKPKRASSTGPTVIEEGGLGRGGGGGGGATSFLFKLVAKQPVDFPQVLAQ